jgi:hypothetical protein
MIYIFHGYLIEIPTQISRRKFKRKFRRRLREAAIYTASTSESALPIKYSEYANVFLENKINNISPIRRTEHIINFEKNSIISYKFIYHLSERELTVLK